MFFKSKILIISVLIITLTLVSIFTFPSLNNLVATNNEPFSEFWLFGPEGTMQNYPHNVSSNQNYEMYVGVKNQLNMDVTYSIRVKICDTIKLLPNSTAASPISAVETFEFILPDEEIWQSKLVFALDYVPINQNLTQIQNININGITSSAKQNFTWDSNRRGFYAILLFELWCYDDSLADFRYVNQNLRLHLNMTG